MLFEISNGKFPKNRPSSNPSDATHQLLPPFRDFIHLAKTKGYEKQDKILSD